MRTDDMDFNRLFEIAPTPLMVLDRALRFVEVNHCYRGITSRSREQLIGRYVFDVFPETPDRQAIVQGAFDDALAGKTVRLDPLLYSISRDGVIEDVWWRTEHVPIRNPAGEVTGLLQHSSDVTAEVSAARMREVVSREYDHRVRNMLARVSAVARRTATGASNLQQFISDFDPRLEAMVRAHDLLANGGWEQLSLSELVAGELQPFLDAAGQRLAMSGPTVNLSSHVAQALGLALHELSTNAAKYGAFSRPEGRIDVSWSLGETGALLLVWRETGVDGLAVPTRSGFGSTIIDKVLPAETGSTVTRLFTDQGLVCTIAIPAPAKPRP